MTILISIARSRITARDRLTSIRHNIGEAIAAAVSGQPSQYELRLVVAELAALRAALDSADALLQRKGYADALPWARETLDAALVASMEDVPAMTLEAVMAESCGGWTEDKSDRLENTLARDKK